MNIEQLIEAEMAEYSDAAYADHGSARHQLRRFADLVRNAVLEEAAKAADEKFDPEWPGDDLSVQAESIASAIRAMKHEVKP